MCSKKLIFLSILFYCYQCLPLDKNKNVNLIKLSNSIQLICNECDLGDKLNNLRKDDKLQIDFLDNINSYFDNHLYVFLILFSIGFIGMLLFFGVCYACCWSSEKIYNKKIGHKNKLKDETRVHYKAEKSIEKSNNDNEETNQNDNDDNDDNRSQNNEQISIIQQISNEQNRIEISKKKCTTTTFNGPQQQIYSNTIELNSSINDNNSSYEQTNVYFGSGVESNTYSNMDSNIYSNIYSEIDSYHPFNETTNENVLEYLKNKSTDNLNTIHNNGNETDSSFDDDNLSYDNLSDVSSVKSQIKNKIVKQQPILNTSL